MGAEHWIRNKKTKLLCVCKTTHFSRHFWRQRMACKIKIIQFKRKWWLFHLIINEIIPYANGDHVAISNRDTYSVETRKTHSIWATKAERDRNNETGKDIGTIACINSIMLSALNQLKSKTNVSSSSSKTIRKKGMICTSFVQLLRSSGTLTWPCSDVEFDWRTYVCSSINISSAALTIVMPF